MSSHWCPCELVRWYPTSDELHEPLHSLLKNLTQAAANRLYWRLLGDYDGTELGFRIRDREKKINDKKKKTIWRRLYPSHVQAWNKARQLKNQDVLNYIWMSEHWSTSGPHFATQNLNKRKIKNNFPDRCIYWINQELTL